MKEVGRMIRLYRKKAKLTQPALAKRLEEEAGITITNKAISAWESGYAEPSATTFLYVCRILNIPDVMEAFFGTNPANPMAVLNDSGKAKVVDYIDELVHPVSYLKESPADYGSAESAERKNNIVEFPTETIRNKVRKKSFYARVSAGTGDFLDSDEFTWIDVDEDIADKFDYAVTVHGDSMEPDFHDHDMVYVKQQNHLENGQIGIFCLNNDAYIKNPSPHTFKTGAQQPSGFLRSVILMELENHLRECRIEKGVFQQEVAAAVGVDRRSILRYEKGERIPNLQTALRLSMYYEKTVNEIFEFVKG